MSIEVTTSLGVTTYETGAYWVVSEREGLTVLDLDDAPVAEYPYGEWRSVRRDQG